MASVPTNFTRTLSRRDARMCMSRWLRTVCRECMARWLIGAMCSDETGRTRRHSSATISHQVRRFHLALHCQSRGCRRPRLQSFRARHSTRSSRADATIVTSMTLSVDDGLLESLFFLSSMTFLETVGLDVPLSRRSGSTSVCHPDLYLSHSSFCPFLCPSCFCRPCPCPCPYSIFL